MSEWSRRRVLETGLKGLGAGLVGSAVAQAAGNSDDGNGMNVLFIAVDDLRPQLNCYGRSQMISPNLDRLAREGMMFERTYCQQAVCAPSRASLLTGLRPDSTEIYDLDTPVRKQLPNVLTLPQHFKNNGYQTAGLGKLYHHHRDDQESFTRGVWHPNGTWPGYVTEEIAERRQRLWEEGDKKKKRWRVLGPPTESADVKDEVYPDGKITQRAIQEMRRMKDGPFFLGVGYYKPHLAFACPQKYWDMYDRDKIDLADNPFRPKGAPDLAMHNWGELRAYHNIPQKGRLSDEMARKLVHGYYACTTFIDTQVGKLLDGLERLGLADNTVVVLWGDHGWNLREHGLWCKHCNFETSVHAPLILKAPGIESPTWKSPALTEFVDIYPTLSDLCGLPLPDHLEGTSLVPLLERPNRNWKPAAFSQYPRGRIMGYSMKTDRYRYTEWQKPDSTVAARELYDHEEDPQENVNVAGRDSNQRLVKKLSDRLNAGWKAALPDA